MSGADPLRGQPLHPPEDWEAALTQSGREREEAMLALHAMLLRIARADARRRATEQRITGPELDDIAQQAADDAMVAIIGKLGQFRGESKFTTWAYKFVVFEVGVKINRHRWNREPFAVHDPLRWDQLVDASGMQPETESEWRELVDAIRQAVEDDLTPKQRSVFLAIVVEGRPLDALAADLGSNRNAIYKVMFDARRKIRTALDAKGFFRTTRRLNHQSGRSDDTMARFDRLLNIDPGDAGCDAALDLLHVYAQLLAADAESARARYHDVAAHLRACGPCAEDLQGLLDVVFQGDN